MLIRQKVKIRGWFVSTLLANNLSIGVPKALSLPSKEEESNKSKFDACKKISLRDSKSERKIAVWHCLQKGYPSPVEMNF